CSCQRNPGQSIPAGHQLSRVYRVAAPGNTTGCFGLYGRRAPQSTVWRRGELGSDPEDRCFRIGPDAGFEPSVRAEHAGRSALASDEGWPQREPYFVDPGRWKFRAQDGRIRTWRIELQRPELVRREQYVFRGRVAAILAFRRAAVFRQIRLAECPDQ